MSVLYFCKKLRNVVISRMIKDWIKKREKIVYKFYLWSFVTGETIMEFREDIGTPDEKTADVETEKEKVNIVLYPVYWKIET